MTNYAQIFGSIPNSQGGIATGPNQNMSSMFGPSPIEQKIQQLAQQQTQPKKYTKQDLFNKVDKAVSQGYTPDEAMTELLKSAKEKGYQIEGVDIDKELGITPQIDTTTFIGKLEQAGRERMQQEADIKSSDANFFSKQLQLLGNKAGAFSDIVGAGVSEALSTITPDSIENKVINEVSDFMQSQGVQDTVKTAKEVYDILPENVQKNVEALGNIGLGILDVIGAGQAGKVLKPIAKGTLETTGNLAKGAKNALFPTESLDDIVLKVSQGAEKDIPMFKKAIQQIDTTGIKDYKTLDTTFGNKIKELATKQDSLLPTDAKYSINKLTTTSEGGKVKVNYVQKALNDLDELYTNIGDINGQERILNLMDKKKLSIKDINDIAREYNIEFGRKAFSPKTGDALTSVNAQAFETTRKGVKEVSRKLLPDNSVKLIDEELTSLYTAKRLTEQMQEKVIGLSKKIQNRGLVEKLARGVGRTIDIATMGGPRAFFTSFLPSNIGNKVMNSLDIQEKLGKNLKKMTKLLKDADTMTDETLLKKLQDLFKSFDGELKNKAQDLLDKGAQKVGAKINFMDTTKGTGINGKIDYPKELIDEAKKYKSVGEFVKNKSFSEELGKNINGELSKGTIKLGDGELKFSVERDNGDNYMIIDLISVKTQKKGIGTKLMRRAETIANEEGLDRVELGAFPQDKTINSRELLGFYEKLGYEIKDSSPFDGDMYYDMYKNPYSYSEKELGMLDKNELKQIYQQANK